MHKLKYLAIATILVMAFSLAGPSFNVFARPLAATSPTLGASGSYSVLGGETVTNTGPTTTNGDVGVAPGTAITGFPPGIAGPPGTIHSNDASAIAAQADNLTAFLALSAAPNVACTQSFAGVTDLSGMTLTPGVYCFDSSAQLTNGTPLTLDGGNVLTATWIFRMVSGLNTTAGVKANVVIINGGLPCNVWWKVGSSATIGSGTSFIGNILALTSISLGTGASLNGRVLAQTGAVTLNTNTITGPICSAQAASSTAQAASSTAQAAQATQTVQAERDQQYLVHQRDRLTATAMAAIPTSAPVTATSIPPTATLLPAVAGLPKTGGAPLQDSALPWSLVMVGFFSAIALALGVRTYRNSKLPKQ
jgi:hypothetical protein